jgi:tellurite resistance protein TerC
VVVLAGIFLVFTGVKMLLIKEGDKDPGQNPVVRLLRRWLPVTEDLADGKFVVHRSGILMVSPLFVCLLMVELSDIVFAIDSVPAIFAITKEPLIVFTSNIMAILGLRSLYFLLAGCMDRFHYLKYALAAILVLVGLKMAWLNGAMGGKFPIGISLSVIFGLLVVAMTASWLRPLPPSTPTKPPTERLFLA